MRGIWARTFQLQPSAMLTTCSVPSNSILLVSVSYFYAQESSLCLVWLYSYNLVYKFKIILCFFNNQGLSNIWAPAVIVWNNNGLKNVRIIWSYIIMDYLFTINAMQSNWQLNLLLMLKVSPSLALHRTSRSFRYKEEILEHQLDGPTPIRQSN